MACGENYRDYRCEKCGNLRRVPIYCKKRTCQQCAKKRARDLIKAYLPIAESFQWASLLTLTLLSVSSKDIRSQLDKILASFCKLRRRKIWNAEKGIYHVEIIKKGEKLWFIHLHALIDSKWMDQKAISKAWLNITGNSYVVDIRRIKGERRRSLREVLKYQTKMWELSQDDEIFIENVFKGRRFVGSFGVQKPEKEKFISMKCKCGGDLVPFEEPYHRRIGSADWRNNLEYDDSS
jgi:hypothetical protein